ncbi:MAG: hypothetical protein ACJAT2_000386 [Bacteriovoracaceae bacterium]|jgi:hypothetical protein
MMKLYSLVIFSLLSTSAFAKVSFTCSYADSFKVESKGKVKTRYGKPIVKVKGSLKEDGGGKLSITSDYLYGTKKKQKVKFYRAQRSNESALSFAKFHNKSNQQVQDKVWLSRYLKFSLPKKALKGKDKGFTAYFSFFQASEDVKSIGSEDPTATEVEVTEDELKEFSRENEKEFEYKLWCKKA